MKNTTRAEHMGWCKARAKEYLQHGDTSNAYASMISDLGKHPETSGHPAIELGMLMLMSGNLDSHHEMEKFIDGFN